MLWGKMYTVEDVVDTVDKKEVVNLQNKTKDWSWKKKEQSALLSDDNSRSQAYK